MAPPAPVLPDYAGGSLPNLLGALTGTAPGPTPWVPEAVAGADSVVLFLLDGLGWDQLQERRHLAPTLASMAGGPITSVAPTTTATALTSVTTGLPPAEHGLVGYRVHVDGRVLNVLRWAADGSDCRRDLPPTDLQAIEPFHGLRPPVVTKAEFNTSGFTGAHLRNARMHGWWLPSALPVECRRLTDAGEPFVYAYYEGVDKTSHLHGLGEHFAAELTFADGLVAQLLDSVPPEVAVVVTADHGQVEVGDAVRYHGEDLLDLVHLQSGEGRFRWLHAQPGAEHDLFDLCRERYGHESWVVTRDQVIEERWFGPRATSALDRLGDVALAPFADVSYYDPDDSGPYELVGRHGSMTSAEMLVPLIAARGRRI